MKRRRRMKRRSRILDCIKTYWAVRNDGYWLDAYAMAQKMADSHRDKMVSPPVGPIQLVKLAVELSCGLDYYLTIRVQGDNGFSNDYAVKVWRKPADAPYEIMDFDKIEGSEKVIKRRYTGLRETKRGKKSLTHSKGQCSMILRSSIKTEDHAEGSTELVSQVASSGLRARGFYILLEQIRNEKPNLNYAKARKVASSRWRELSEAEKRPLMDKAAKRPKIK